MAGSTPVMVRGDLSMIVRRIRPVSGRIALTIMSGTSEARHIS
jgi:hypothetical protein